MLSSGPRVAEFFAGIGLVRMALEREGCRVVFANDISAAKQQLYATNFGSTEYLLADIRSIDGRDVPDVEIATASFPCTDLSLAGGRAGLGGEHSGMFWEFARVLDGMGHRRPEIVLLENVAGLYSSAGGSDLRAVMSKLNEFGYWCDAFMLDARWFVPQSRPRLFIVGSRQPISSAAPYGLDPRYMGFRPSDLRTEWFTLFAVRNPDLRLQALPLQQPPTTMATLADVVERLEPADERWWTSDRQNAFLSSLSDLNETRVSALRQSPRLTWRAAYRRTRNGVAVWEVRPDPISGCLRTARGGSSKQAIVEAGEGQLRVRWMTPTEYARLQGAGEYKFGTATPSQVLFGFGDAVCVPVVAWIAREYLMPLLSGQIREKQTRYAAG
ncbi:MAG TPA: DNA (cytosine-5-)-methyltransferase [Chloroflexi bacterium]|jgi:DNA (cytosine-5)-methyltransferase 1|nr:DNA (cytosine-5-)-methyltransferase [Chloroflexota bacterium]